MTETISSEQLKVTVNRLGAEITSVKNNNGLEYIWQARKEVWPRHAPVLFPVVGKLKNNSYQYQGRTYELGQHGFARDLQFELVNKTADNFVFELRSDEKTKEKFPFDFTFRINYKVEGNTVITSYSVINPGTGTLLFSVGAHPGFNCPLEQDEQFGDYYIEFEQESFIQTTLKDGLRSESNKILPLRGKKLYLSDHLFDSDALVFENHQIHTIRLVSAKTGRSISMDSSGWPYFGIWSKKGCKEFVCLEPWYGIADHENAGGDIEKKDGILTLAPGGEFRASFSFTCD